MKKIIGSGPFFCLLALAFFSLAFTLTAQAITEAVNVPINYLYNFNKNGTLIETGSEGISPSPYWWLNSGGYLRISDGRGKTNQGRLSLIDPFRVLYAKNNSTDTDNGYYPQNIFRLLTRSKWQDSREEAYFVIRKDNLSSSSNRNASNGLLLMSRYIDSDNLYYAGVRVDGSAIIKKKKNGVYYTLAETKNVFPGTYNKSSSPNLLPKDKWIGLRSEVRNLANGEVAIKLFVDNGWQGQWKQVASAIDDGKTNGGNAHTKSGSSGIRTDFMDVEFENFRLKNI